MARRDTRELILGTSLDLFNEFGEPNVTTNHIADEADISPGNLYYHFRSKDDIVLELFKRFAARFQPLLEVPGDIALQPEEYWLQLHLAFEVKGEFRFLYRNLGDLAARVPDLGRAMRGLLQRERTAAGNALRGLAQSGALVAEPWQMDLLGDTILMAQTYWIPFAELRRQGAGAEGSAQIDAIARVLLLVTPWLREPERDQFSDLARRYLERKS